MKPTTKSVNDVLTSIENFELHPTRQLARRLVNEYRKGSAIDPRYDFNAQSVELRRIFYNAACWWSMRRWYVRWLLWWR